MPLVILRDRIGVNELVASATFKILNLKGAHVQIMKRNNSRLALSKKAGVLDYSLAAEPGTSGKRFADRRREKFPNGSRNVSKNRSNSKAANWATGSEFRKPSAK